jgi:hypothetical protein
MLAGSKDMDDAGQLPALDLRTAAFQPDESAAGRHAVVEVPPRKNNKIEQLHNFPA